jgi:transposase
MIKYRVRLHQEERAQLLATVSTGPGAAVKRLHARILRKADVSAESRRWTDMEIAEALDTSASTVHRVRQAFVEQGLEAALARKRPTGRQYSTLDGTQEAQLVAVACNAPPAGSARWTLKLLAAKLVELDIVDTISPECVRTTLKKTFSNRGSSTSGCSRRRPSPPSSVLWRMSWRYTRVPTTPSVPRCA